MTEKEKEKNPTFIELIQGCTIGLREGPNLHGFSM